MAIVERGGVAKGEWFEHVSDPQYLEEGRFRGISRVSVVKLGIGIKKPQSERKAYTMERREALRLMITTVVALLVSCRKNPPLEVNVVPENTAAPTKSPTQTTAPTQTALPAATELSQPTPTTQRVVDQETQAENGLPTVYMTTNISGEGLMNLYQTLDHQAHGNVAVKISSGEPGGHYFLAPALIEPLVSAVNGTIVECNTVYGGRRSTTASHHQVMVDHGFAAIAPVDIMDADADMELPIEGGKHLAAAVVGSHYSNYDFTINLAHFKGHGMAGFGGVIKNMSIGISSAAGKGLIHSAGASATPIWSTEQNAFLESMVEAFKGIADYVGENIIYINVMNNLSVDCDCDSNPSPPTMEEIGILASLDPVAVDQACIDLVYGSPDGQDLIKRIESRNGLHALAHAETMGLGSRQYKLVRIDS
jgi:uncharacterized protein